MTDPILFVLGAVIVLITFCDFLRTTVSLSGLGFISARVAAGLWRILSALARRTERSMGRSIRKLIGPLILIMIAAIWVALHLLGYVLMYRAGLSLVESQTGQPATLVQTVAFAGSALSTLGASTVSVTGGWWDILSMIAAVNGMILLTLSVSFVLNVLQTTNSARAFAMRFNALARTAGDSQGPAQVAGLGPDLAAVAVKMVASPLPGFFVPDDPRMDFPLAIRKLCDMVRDGDDEPFHDAHTAELMAALSLLGRQVGPDRDHRDMQAARAWADRHSIPRQEQAEGRTT